MLRGLHGRLWVWLRVCQRHFMCSAPGGSPRCLFQVVAILMARSTRVPSQLFFLPYTYLYSCANRYRSYHVWWINRIATGRRRWKQRSLHCIAKSRPRTDRSPSTPQYLSSETAWTKIWTVSWTTCRVATRRACVHHWRSISRTIRPRPAAVAWLLDAADTLVSSSNKEITPRGGTQFTFMTSAHDPTDVQERGWVWRRRLLRVWCAATPTGYPPNHQDAPRIPNRAVT